MKKIFRRVAISGVVLLVLLGAIGIFIWLQFRGTIPYFADTNDISYEKLCGVMPTSGKVWTAGGGFGSGSVYYRLHLAKSSYTTSSATLLTNANLQRLANAPWWWGIKPNGKATVISSGGMGYNTPRHEIYDPDKEILYVYCEWD